MVQIECTECGNSKIEANGLCASCNYNRRKQERIKVKEVKPINKVSAKRAAELRQYNKEVKVWIVGKICAVHGIHPATQCHHAKGRNGKLLLDKRYWVPVCGEAHDWITEHSKEAVEQGYSFKRIT